MYRYLDKEKVIITGSVEMKVDKNETIGNLKKKV